MELEITAHHLLKPLHRIRNTRVQPFAQLRLDIFQLGCHPFADGLPVNGEVARFVANSAIVSET